ncbi:MAG: His-Xaa-Ser system radical SAM maturase HxsB [Deltaproteobacteria bacterium]|nr:His-Xaa-Ser system radical SAM maturase HxsB [Deltaproteobacteria bacterium]
MNLLQLRRRSSTFALPFNHRVVGGKVLITNTEGAFLLLTPAEFERFAEGNVDRASELFTRLKERNFIRGEENRESMIQRIRTRKSFLSFGPNLHIIVVTLRCNETCVYCHASRAGMDAVQTDLTKELAEKTVDQILKTTNPNVTIEFQGGEPLVNFEVVKHTIEYALEANKKVGKQLEFTMVSNLSLMDEDKLAYLVGKKVQICTSIDGPEHLHDKQRKLPKLSAHQKASYWIKRINDEYERMGLDTSLYHVEALLTTTRDTLPLWKEVVDTYVSLGCKALFLRPVDPFGFAEKTGGRVEYPRTEYLQFYRQATDYMLELNKQGVQILERFAAIFLTKILGGEDPNFLDIRNPCGAGIGQVAYNYDGKIFTCDEGRMVHEMGDSTFLIGDVTTSTYRDLMGHETVRALALASNLEAQPDCVNCTYQPYCGVCPVHNHRTQGTIFGRMRESTLCAVHKGIQDYLFEKLGAGDPQTLETFKKWTTVRDRTHFLQSCAV